MLLTTLLVATSADAATYGLSGRIPRYGSQTYSDQDFTTTNQFNDINFAYQINPYSSNVKPVRCSDFASISTAKSFAANDHSEKVIASNVVDGTCFNINIDSATTDHWDFSATIRA